MRSRTTTDGSERGIAPITAFGISRPAPTAAPTVPPTIAPTGPPISPPARAPFAAPSAVVDWAKAALDASSEAAANEITKRVFMSSLQIVCSCAVNRGTPVIVPGSQATATSLNPKECYCVTVLRCGDLVPRHQLERTHHRR